VVGSHYDRVYQCRTRPGNAHPKSTFFFELQILKRRPPIYAGRKQLKRSPSPILMAAYEKYLVAFIGTFFLVLDRWHERH